MADCTSVFGVPVDPTCLVTPRRHPRHPGAARGQRDRPARGQAIQEAVGQAVASRRDAVGQGRHAEPHDERTEARRRRTRSASCRVRCGGTWPAAAVLAVIVAGARWRGSTSAEPGRELVKALLTLVVVAGAGLTAIALAVDRGGRRSRGGSSTARSTGRTSARTSPPARPGGDHRRRGDHRDHLGLLAFFASLIQIALMVVRGGMLVILAGILPLSASATNTEWGRAWFKKCIAWLIAFILYKPAAAIVYATAFRLVGLACLRRWGRGRRSPESDHRPRADGPCAHRSACVDALRGAGGRRRWPAAAAGRRRDGRRRDDDDADGRDARVKVLGRRERRRRLGFRIGVAGWERAERRVRCGRWPRAAWLECSLARGRRKPQRRHQRRDRPLAGTRWRCSASRRGCRGSGRWWRRGRGRRRCSGRCRRGGWAGGRGCSGCGEGGRRCEGRGTEGNRIAKRRQGWSQWKPVSRTFSRTATGASRCRQAWASWA